jgi:hypothetical protein
MSFMVMRLLAKSLNALCRPAIGDNPFIMHATVCHKDSL